MNAELHDGFAGLVNEVTGMGTKRDKLMASAWTHSVVPDEILSTMFRDNWIAKKLVTIPVDDMLRQGWRWQAETKDVTLIEKEERRLIFRKRLHEALIRDNLYGGGVLVMGLPGQSNEEIKPEDVRKGDMQFLLSMGRHELTIEDVETDPVLGYGEPKMYKMALQNGQTLSIHPSRVIPFVGRPVVGRFGAMGFSEFWGDSQLAKVINDIEAVTSSVAGVARLMHELAIAYWKISGLTDKLMTTDGEKRVRDLISLNERMKSSQNAVVMDSEDEVDIVTAAFAGVPDAMRMLMQNVCGAADIPLTRFLGASPDGMNATGESDTRNYYDRLAGDRAHYVEPGILRFDQYFLRSALGDVDTDDVYRIWNPLWQLDETKQLELDKQWVEMVSQLANTGIVHDHVLSSVTRNRMIDSPNFPGAETAFDEADKMPEPEPEEVESANSLQGPSSGQPPANRPSLRVAGGTDVGDEDLELGDKGNQVYNRWPAGTSKGGQFAPKGKSGGHAAAYTKAVKAYKEAKSAYTSNPTYANEEVLNKAKAEKKAALKAYYENKGTKAAAKAEAAAPKPAGLSIAEREANIAQVKKEKSAALKEYKSHPTGTVAKKEALAKYNELNAKQKKMEEGLEKAKAGGSTTAPASTQSNATASSPKTSAGPETGNKNPSGTKKSHDAAMDAVVKAHPHPTFGKKEAEVVIQKGLKGEYLGPNQAKLFATYQKEMGIEPKPSSSYSSTYHHPAHSPIKELDIETNWAAAQSDPKVKAAKEKFISEYNAKGKWGSTDAHKAYVFSLADLTQAEVATPKKAQSTYVTQKTSFGTSEVSSLKAYSGSAYSSINSSLRSGKISSTSVKNHIKNIDAAFAKSTADKDFVVQRGLAMDAVEKYIKDGNFKVGATMIDKGYVSTTSAYGTAQSFSYGGYHMVVKVKKGQSIIPLKSLSHFSGEEEFLMPRNTAFQITHIDKTAKIVVVDVL